MSIIGRENTPVLVIGEETAKGLAVDLASDWDVRLLSTDETVVTSSATQVSDTRHVDFRASELKEHSSGVSLAVVLTERDRAALLVTQLLNTVCDVDRVFVRVDDPSKKDAFENLNCTVIETAKLFRPEVESILGAVQD
jgi:Trk K+ transport system NAD-binding subunit